jgi:vacuole morphology and inheritance protein 14
MQMLSDSNREIRQAADSALSEFLREVSVNSVVEFGPIVAILVAQSHSKERLNRLTAITWLAELIHHPYSGGDALLPYHAQVLGAILSCLSDGEVEIRVVAERTHDDLLTLVRDTTGDFELRPLLDTLMDELLGKEDVPTKMAALRWINMLLEKRQGDMVDYSEDLLPVLLRTLSDPSDAVVLLNLQVLSRISLAQKEEMEEAGEKEVEEAQFQLVLNAILQLFATDRQLLETRGSLIIRKLCVLLNAKSVYIRMAEALSKYAEDYGVTKKNEGTDMASLDFVSTMVQTLNLILLTAAELHELRSALAATFEGHASSPRRLMRNKGRDGVKVFSTLFNCWCHNPVSTFSLCLLAQAYDLSFALIKRFSELDVTVGFLMQVDKLVHLLESPIFVHVRLQLLDVEAEYHAPLLKALYGLLMLLPQSDAFRSLNDRLTTICNLRDNLGITSTLEAEHDSATTPSSILTNRLLQQFDKVVEQHKKARARMEEEALLKNEEVVANGVTNGETNSATLISSSAVSSMHSPVSPGGRSVGGRSDFSLSRRPLSPRSGVSQ